MALFRDKFAYLRILIIKDMNFVYEATLMHKDKFDPMPRGFKLGK